MTVKKILFMITSVFWSQGAVSADQLVTPTEPGAKLVTHVICSSPGNIDFVWDLAIFQSQQEPNGYFFITQNKGMQYPETESQDVYHADTTNTGPNNLVLQRTSAIGTAGELTATINLNTKGATLKVFHVPRQHFITYTCQPAR